MESVLIQKQADFELIVVDDGSEDDTLAYLEPLEQEGRLQVLRQSHQGVSAARNTGVAMGKGEFVAFLDSDDEWLPGKLRAQVNYLRAHAWDIVQTREIWIRKGKRVNAPAHLEKSQGDLFSASLMNCMITPSSVMMTRKLWDATGGFDPEFPACEDYDLWLRITCGHRVGLLAENLLIRYGGHSDQLSASVPGLDKYRVMALIKLLKTAVLAPSQRIDVMDIALEKLKIYRAGCEKRTRVSELEWCRKMDFELIGLRQA